MMFQQLTSLAKLSVNLYYPLFIMQIPQQSELYIVINNQVECTKNAEDLESKMVHACHNYYV